MRGRTPFSYALGFAVCVGAAGCESPADACADCQMVRPDLVVSAVEVRAVTRDAVSGLAVVPRDSIDVSITVRNAGRSDAGTPLLALELDGVPAAVIRMPTMRAGSTRRIERRLPTNLPAFLMDRDTLRVGATVVWADDAPDNNTGLSDPFHVPVPALRLRTAFSALALNVNVAYDIVITVENLSRHAALPASRLAFCVHGMGSFCTRADGASGFNAIGLPALAASQRLQWVDRITIPTGITHQNLIDAVAITPCVISASLQAGDVTDAKDRGCAPPAQLFVRPDYEACSPTRLIADTPAQATATCTRPCSIVAFAVDVRAGQTYWIEDANGEEELTLRWRTRYRDEPVDVSSAPGLQPSRSETIYAVTAPKFCGAASEYTVILRQRGAGPER